LANTYQTGLVWDHDELTRTIRLEWDGQYLYLPAVRRFFTGLRPSEQIALLVTDYDARRGVLWVTKAGVLRRDKDRTKTQEDRDVELCPRTIRF
jgi:integrase